MSLLAHFFKSLCLYLKARIWIQIPHQGEKSDPDPVPHQGDKSNPDHVLVVWCRLQRVTLLALHQYLGLGSELIAAKHRGSKNIKGRQQQNFSTIKKLLPKIGCAQITYTSKLP
jgi:hypothetical protein